MFPRIRDISDPFGAILRLSVEPHPSGALIVIERPDRSPGAQATLDLYGSEILAGFLLSAQLAVPSDMPDEEIAGEFPTRFQLSYERGSAVVIDQLGSNQRFFIAQAFWERLHAELGIVNAHARELARRQATRAH